MLIDLNAVLSNIETDPTGYSGTFELTENELTASYDPADITANPDLPYNELDLLLASLSVAEGGGITTIIFEGLEYTYVPASAAPQNVAGFYRFEDTDTAPGLNNWGRGGTRLVTTVKSWFDRREDDSQKASITMKNANDAQFTINYDVEEIQLAPSYYFLTDDGQFIQLDNVSNELLNKINDDVADLLLRSGDVSFQDYLETYLTQFRIDVNYYSKLELAGRSDLVERKQVTRLNDLKTYIEGWTDDKVSVTEELPIVVFNFIGFLYSYIDITDMSTNTQIQYLLNPVLFDPTSPYYVYDHFVTTNYPQFNISDDLFMTHENAFVYHDVLFDTGPEGDWYFYRNISEGAFVARQTMIDGFVNDGIDMSFIFHERHTIELYPILSSSGLNTNRQIPLSENLTFFLNYEIIEEDEDWNETIIEEYTFLRQPVDISTLTTEQEIFEYLVNLGTGLDITLDEYGEYNGTSFSIEFNFTLVSDGQTYEVNPMNFAYYETNTEPYWLTRINAFTYQNMLGGHILDTLMDEYDLDLNQALFILNDPNLQVTYNMSIFYQKYVDAA